MRVGISKLRVENSATSKNLQVDILNIIIFLQKFHSVPFIFISFNSHISAQYFSIQHSGGMKKPTKIIDFFLDSLLGMQQNKLNEEVVDNHFH
jgi:hypothetical protein